MLACSNFQCCMCCFSARLSSYEVSVMTGDISGAGTDANVYVVLFGDKGETGQFYHNVLLTSCGSTDYPEKTFNKSS